VNGSCMRGRWKTLGQCHYAALWGARGASEGGVCPGVLLMLVGIGEIGRGR